MSLSRGPDSPGLVLGLTGSNAAGKGEVAERLRRRGFALHSLSDIVREEAAARGLSAERENLIRVGNELRRLGGPGVLAERIVPRLGRRDVVDSIRNPSEVEVLRRLERFVLLGVVAPIELRFERARARARAGDPETLARFREREEEENTADPHAQRLAATLALADHVLSNRGSLEQLEREVERVLALVESGAPSDAG